MVSNEYLEEQQDIKDQQFSIICLTDKLCEKRTFCFGQQPACDLSY